MDRRIDGILFDLGDTLLDFGQISVPKLFRSGAKLAYEYLRRMGQPLPRFRVYHRRQYWAIQWNYLKSRLTGREFNSLDLITRLGRKIGQTLTDEQLIELAWLWYQPLRKRAAVEEGLPQMLADLRASGLTLGLVSNTFVPPQVLDRHLQQEGMLDHLPLRVYSCQVGIRKPRAEIFQMALQQAALTPSRTIFVGDSPRTDIVGANRVGMISVLKDPTGRHINGRTKPSHMIRSILELPAIIDEYNRA